MAFCPSCGSQVDGRFCQKCGATVDAGAVPPGAAPAAGSSGLTDNAAGALCYLFGLITGILFLVDMKGHTPAFRPTNRSIFRSSRVDRLIPGEVRVTRGAIR